MGSVFETNKSKNSNVIVEKNTSHEKAIEYGTKFLTSVGQEGQSMTANECQFCHIQQAPQNVEKDIKEQGFYIQKMEGCP